MPALPPCRALIGSRLRPAGFSIGGRHSPPPKPPRRPNVGTVFLFGGFSLAIPQTPKPSVFHRSVKDLCVARREKIFTGFFVDKCLKYTDLYPDFIGRNTPFFLHISGFFCNFVLGKLDVSPFISALYVFSLRIINRPMGTLF